MIAGLAAAAILSASQPGRTVEPLVVQLCNDTPARVAYSVIYRGGDGSQRRRGWLTVEPRDCLEGGIGQTIGGPVHVHAMSGGYVWPGEIGDRQACVPPSAHDDAARLTPCVGGEREAGFDTVVAEALRGRFRVRYRVSCEDLQGEDRALCALGRRARDGFAEPVLSFEVCNRTAGNISLAVAAEHADRSGRDVVGWRGVEPGRCRDVWRGFTSERAVYVYAVGRGEVQAGAGFARHCVRPAGAFERRAPMEGELSCEQGLSLRAFRPVRFREGVTRMTLDYQGP